MLITTHLDLAEGHLEEARLSTIRGFCNELLHERLVEALDDPRFAVVTEPGAEAEYGRAFERWIEGRAWKNPEGLRRALRRRTSLDDGDPVAQLACTGWTKAGWRDFRAPRRRVAFDREKPVDALGNQVRARPDAPHVRPTVSTRTTGSRARSPTSATGRADRAKRLRRARSRAGRAGVQPSVPASAQGAGSGSALRPTLRRRTATDLRHRLPPRPHAATPRWE